MKKITALLVLAGAAAAANGQVFNFTGPFNSDGADNAAANGILNFNYVGAGGLGTWSFTGTATTGGVGSYRDELRVRLTDTNTAVTGTSGILATGSTWTGTIAGSGAIGGGLWNMTNGDVMSARFWETFNDTGIDATWSNISLTFSAYIAPPAPASIFLGNFSSPASFTMASNGAAGDTVLALFDSNGLVLGTDDDSGVGAFSQLISNLGLGTYYMAVVEYNGSATANAGPGFSVLAGNAAIAAMTASVTDGITTYTSAGESLAVGGVQWYSFTVPTPGAAALLSLGGLAASRRRRV